MNESQPIIWRLVPGFVLHRQDFSDGICVYHEGSGDTHLLAPWLGTLLDQLTQAPATAEQLRAALEAGEDELLHALSELRRLELVEPCPKP